MKLQFISLFFAAALIVSCSTSRTSTSSNEAYSNVPAVTQTAFTTQYPGAMNVTWSTYDPAIIPIDWDLAGWQALDNSDYAVRFNLDNSPYYAWYDANGNWIGTSAAVPDYKYLPGA